MYFLHFKIKDQICERERDKKIMINDLNFTYKSSTKYYSYLKTHETVDLLSNNTV